MIPGADYLNQDCLATCETKGDCIMSGCQKDPSTKAATKPVERTNTGLCAGGPKDGQQMTQSWTVERMAVPRSTGQLGFSYEFYVWHPLLRMWIWGGDQSNQKG